MAQGLEQVTNQNRQFTGLIVSQCNHHRFHRIKNNTFWLSTLCRRNDLTLTLCRYHYEPISFRLHH